jgi:pimeloyl-ACP methyl ester carboxylesterase
MSDILERAARPPDLTVAYGVLGLQIADLYRASPDDDRCSGLVVLLHGGFWRNRYDRSHLRPLAVALADRGFTVALPEFRRLGDAGGGFPGTFDDVLLALERLPGLVSGTWGSASLGPTTILVGHSAGAHLAIWSQAAVSPRRPVSGPGSTRTPAPPPRGPRQAPAGGIMLAENGGGRGNVFSEGRAARGASESGASGRADPVSGSGVGNVLAVSGGVARRPARGRVDTVVSLAGVLDLARAHELNLSGGVVRELLAEPAGDDPKGGPRQDSDAGLPEGAEFEARLHAADPMRLATPVELGVGTLLVHGTEDSDVPVSFSRDYASRDARIRLLEFPGAGHFDPIDPTSPVATAWIDALTRST